MKMDAAQAEKVHQIDIDHVAAPTFFTFAF